MYPMELQGHIRNPRRNRVSTQVQSWISFTPLSLAPVLWLDASDTATITASSGAVSQWNDKSGNGYNVAQSTSANQPTTGSNTINGRNALSFDGGDSLIRSTGTRLVDASAGTFTAFSLFVTNKVDAIRGVLTQDSSTASRMPQMMRIDSAAFQLVRITPSAFTDGAGVTLNTNIAYVGASILRSNNIETYVNGSSDGATSITGTNTTNTSYIEVGNASGFGTFYWDGLIAEILVYPRAFTNAELNLIGGYLASKWNSTWTTL